LIQNSKFKIQNSRKGFTLIELLVVMAIIGILAATALVNFGKNEDRDVRQEADRLTSFLREVQNKALTAERAGISPSGKVCGFGVTFEGGINSAKIFYVETKDEGTVNSLDISCADVSKINASGTNSNASIFPNEEFNFRKDVKIEGDTPRDIFFLAPNGEVYSDGASATDPITINLTKEGLETPVPVNIDPSGRIY